MAADETAPEDPEEGYEETEEARYLAKFDPLRDSGDWVSEDPEVYAARMQQTALPHWPAEVLIEWFHRHPRHLFDYAFLGFEKFRFRRESWPLTRIPGFEAFADSRNWENFADLERRAQGPHVDWLAKYMLEEGTWNTPIVLLETPRPGIVAPGRWKLKHPLHLLEGHRRLTFLNALRNLGKAKTHHDVWLVDLDQPTDNPTHASR